MKHPITSMLQAVLGMMLLFLSGLLGWLVSYPGWPTASECTQMCAEAGQRVVSFRPHNNRTGSCYCAPRLVRRPCQ